MTGQTNAKGKRWGGWQLFGSVTGNTPIIIPDINKYIEIIIISHPLALWNSFYFSINIREIVDEFFFASGNNIDVTYRLTISENSLSVKIHRITQISTSEDISENTITEIYTNKNKA